MHRRENITVITRSAYYEAVHPKGVLYDFGHVFTAQVGNHNSVCLN